MSQCWGMSDIPDLTNKIAIVTGGNVGLGFQSCVALAKAGCRVVMACRDEHKGRQAIASIKDKSVSHNIEVISLDLTSMESIRHFVTLFNGRYSHLNILLNNAGVVNLPELQRTGDGYEMHFATNHLGHFSLTGLLLPLIINTPQSRVVTVSSGGHKFGEIMLDDIHWRSRPYHRMKSYGDSKLANLLFSFQLQRYFEQHKIDALSLAAHPGLTGTERQQSIGVGGKLSKWLASPVEKGVLPQLRACCDPCALGGEYYGPRFSICGKPVKATPDDKALSESMAQALWNYSSELTEIFYQFE